MAELEITQAVKQMIIAIHQVPDKKVTANAQSGLFRLPAELRIYIYELVIGKENFHISYARPHERTVATPCVAITSDAEVIGDITAHHERCRAQSPQQLCVLSLVCRQMHTEASLLPFELNRFTFASLSSVERSFYHLSPAQSAAFREVHFVQAGGRTEWFLGAGQAAQRSEHVFEGVQRVSIVFKLCGLDHFRTELRTAEGQDSFLEALCTFRFPRVREVHVKIHQAAHHACFSLETSVLDVWEARIKSRILQTAENGAGEVGAGSEAEN